MRVCHGFTAVFDDPNLVSCAGLVPVLRLAERAGLQRLVAGHVSIRWPPRRPLRRALQQVIGADVECRNEGGVQVSVHESLQLDVGLATPMLGTLAHRYEATRRSDPLELII